MCRRRGPEEARREQEQEGIHFCSQGLGFFFFLGALIRAAPGALGLVPADGWGGWGRVEAGNPMRGSY